jgi:hypothetical protein
MPFDFLSLMTLNATSTMLMGRLTLHIRFRLFSSLRHEAGVFLSSERRTGALTRRARANRLRAFFVGIPPLLVSLNADPHGNVSKSFEKTDLTNRLTSASIILQHFRK